MLERSMGLWRNQVWMHPWQLAVRLTQLVTATEQCEGLISSRTARDHAIGLDTPLVRLVSAIALHDQWSEVADAAARCSGRHGASTGHRVSPRPAVARLAGLKRTRSSGQFNICASLTPMNGHTERVKPQELNQQVSPYPKCQVLKRPNNQSPAAHITEHDEPIRGGRGLRIMSGSEGKVFTNPTKNY